MNRKYISIFLTCVIALQVGMLGGFLALRRRQAALPPWPHYPMTAQTQPRLVLLTQDPARPGVLEEIETLQTSIDPSESVQKELWVVGASSAKPPKGWSLRQVQGRRWMAVLAYWGDPVKWVERDGRIRWIMGPPLSPDGLRYLSQVVSLQLFGRTHLCSPDIPLRMDKGGKSFPLLEWSGR